jgi:hypothetical protein
MVAYSFAWTSTIALAPDVGLYADYYFTTTTAARRPRWPLFPAALVLEGWSARILANYIILKRK